MAASRSDGNFSSRWGLILAALGMAIGAGNIWRFPRVAARNGGGAFLVPWLLFTLLWSVPLLMVEFGLGKATRRGPVGAFASLLGRRFAWMGAFVAACTAFIMFYYSVVTGWSAAYFVRSILDFGTLSGSPRSHWAAVTSGSWEAVVFHGLAAGGSALLLARGAAVAIERVCKVLVPLLVALLAAAVLRGLTLPGGVLGLEFLFHVDWGKLSEGRTWLEALSQSAWSTGAGWGLMLTYGAYSRRDEDVGLNSLVTALGDNSASILAAMATLPAIFALSGSVQEAMAVTGADNTGMAFVWMPRLFARMPGQGAVFAAFFFAALTAASLSSLLAMMEMAAKVLVDLGVPRRKALAGVASATFLFGLPSALSLQVFQNQDWVWGLGLLLSGAFVAFAAARYGAGRFREQWINGPGADWRVGRWFDFVVTVAVPVEFLVLLGWWFHQSVTEYSAGRWWDVTAPYSVATCLAQWGLLIAGLLAANRFLAPRKGAAAGSNGSAGEAP